MNQDRNDLGLRALAEADRGQQAPPRVEAALRSAFRARAAIRSERRHGWAIAAAACFLFLLGGTASWFVMSATRQGRTQPAAPKTKPAPLFVAQPRSEMLLAIGDNDLTTEFIPLRYDSEIESGQLVRVRLNPAALVAFGFPMHADRASETVTAEVIYGDDGIARAIRFVR